MGEAAYHSTVAELRKPELLVTEFVSEYPQVYARGPGDPADLIELAGVVGAVGYAIRSMKSSSYLPRSWKGQVPKDVMCARIEGRLSPEEKAAIRPCPTSLRHNVLDAIGVGLFHIGRLRAR